MSVVIVDYGSGNLRSAAKAFAHAGARVVVSDRPEVVAAAERIVLPGVGAFADCLAGLAARPGLIEALSEAVQGRARPFLGICVGMQLLAEWGHEHGRHAGLGWIAGDVRPLEVAGKAWFNDLPLRVPHMGWNTLALDRGDHPLLAGLAEGTHMCFMYFVHGYAMHCRDAADVLASTDYGGPVTAVVARDNVAGVQFHPEKSQAAGLALIANFLAWRP